MAREASQWAPNTAEATVFLSCAIFAAANLDDAPSAAAAQHV